MIKPPNLARSCRKNGGPKATPVGPSLEGSEDVTGGPRCKMCRRLCNPETWKTGTGTTGGIGQASYVVDA